MRLRPEKRITVAQPTRVLVRRPRFRRAMGPLDPVPSRVDPDRTASRGRRGARVRRAQRIALELEGLPGLAMDRQGRHHGTGQDEATGQK